MGFERTFGGERTMNATHRWLVSAFPRAALLSAGPRIRPGAAGSALSAEPGSTVTIPEGHFTFDRSLSLGVNGVTYGRRTR